MVGNSGTVGQVPRLSMRQRIKAAESYIIRMEIKTRYSNWEYNWKGGQKL